MFKNSKKLFPKNFLSFEGSKFFRITFLLTQLVGHYLIKGFISPIEVQSEIIKPKNPFLTFSISLKDILSTDVGILLMVLKDVITVLILLSKVALNGANLILQGTVPNLRSIIF